MTKNDEKLLVSWKGPSSKQNYFVGLLSKKYSQGKLYYNFRYNEEIVSQANIEGFVPFIGLNDLKKEYTSDKLFSVFERRLPNQNRNIFKKIIKTYNLQNSEAVTWEYLKITKGRVATDNLSFLEPVYIHNDKLTYKGEIAGWSYTKEYNNIKINSKVMLRNDELNPKDNEAVEVVDSQNGNVRVGYIQKPFNKIFYRILKKNHYLTGRIDSIHPFDGRPTIVIDESFSHKNFNLEDLNFLVYINS